MTITKSETIKDLVFALFMKICRFSVRASVTERVRQTGREIILGLGAASGNVIGDVGLIPGRLRIRRIFS